MKLFNKDRYTAAQVIILGITGIILGFLIITQARYFTDYASSVGRDSSENIFRKIQILKITNDELAEVVSDLEIQLEEVSGRADALQTIEKEITKNKMIAGEIKISGPGMSLTVDGQISAIWFTDIVNELFASGAESVSINNIRLTDFTIGFDTLPNGQIMVNNVILNSPYTFNAIGDRANLKQALSAPGSILDRLKSKYPNTQTTIQERDKIQMEKI